MDVNRQAWTAQPRCSCTPRTVYVGLRASAPFVQKGEPIALDAIATDLDGRAAVGSLVRLTAERLEWEQVAGRVAGGRARPRGAHAAARKPSPFACTIGAKEGGVYRILARVADAQGRENQSGAPRLGGRGPRAAAARARAGGGDAGARRRRTTSRGDVAKLLVLPPFAPAEGVLTLRRSGLVRERALHDRGGRPQTLAIPIEDGFTPNVHVQVDLVGAAPRDGRGRRTPDARAARLRQRPTST